jgi:hypothetical protein
MSETWYDTMNKLLGKRVNVTLSREPERILTGTLVHFSRDGDVTVQTDDGITHYGWPNLVTELA